MREGRARWWLIHLFASGRCVPVFLPVYPNSSFRSIIFLEVCLVSFELSLFQKASPSVANYKFLWSCAGRWINRWIDGAFQSIPIGRHIIYIDPLCVVLPKELQEDALFSFRRVIFAVECCFGKGICGILLFEGIPVFRVTASLRCSETSHQLGSLRHYGIWLFRSVILGCERDGFGLLVWSLKLFVLVVDRWLWNL